MGLPKFDCAVILECAVEELSWGQMSRDIIRPLGAFALFHELQKLQVPATLINYAVYWDADQLIETLRSWMERHGYRCPLILHSSLFGSDALDCYAGISRVIKHFKNVHGSTLIAGGPVVLADQISDPELLPHAVFQGRSLHLFADWIRSGGDLLPTAVSVKGVDIFQSENGAIIEQPVVPVLYDDFCLNENDIIGFETRVGCKFNCTFCALASRNAKEVHDSTEDQLFTFFDTANRRYGITRFSCMDDTFNEDQVKIDRLLNTVKRLAYRPTIVGYNRFDLIVNDNSQLEQLDQCGFVGHYFGIETFHREASKVIRKGLRKDRAYDTLRLIRDQFPHWHTSTGMIIGVPKEPAEHIMQTVDELCEQRLVKGIIPMALNIQHVPGTDMSNFSKTPEKYGITITARHELHSEWKHDQMDSSTAELLEKRVAAKAAKKGIGALDPWEWIAKSIPVTANEHRSQYIKRKQEYLLGRIPTGVYYSSP